MQNMYTHNSKQSCVDDCLKVGDVRYMVYKIYDNPDYPERW